MCLAGGLSTGCQGRAQSIERLGRYHRALLWRATRHFNRFELTVSRRFEARARRERAKRYLVFHRAPRRYFRRPSPKLVGMHWGYRPKSNTLVARRRPRSRLRLVYGARGVANVRSLRQRPQPRRSRTKPRRKI